MREDQLYPVKLFDDAGYRLCLIYMYLQNIDISFQRVQMRIKEKGRRIPGDSIKSNYYEGLKNLNLTYNEWHNLVIIDNSKHLVFRKNNPNVEVVMKQGKVIEQKIVSLMSIKDYIPNIIEQL